MRIIKIVIFFFLICSSAVKAQSILARKISLNIEQQRLGLVLATIEEKGAFRFSFNSNIVPVDSLVSVHEANLNIAEALDKLLSHRFEYRQVGNFIIIRYAPLELIMQVNESIGSPELYTITGQIIDKNTQQPISDASIYEKKLLVSSISDGNGYFSIRLKNITQPIALTVSKENYKSTVTHFLAEVNITTNRADTVSERFISNPLGDIEDTWLGNALITTKQKLQTLNIGSFISKAPVQFSLLPGLNSHGSLSGQVVNRFSFNAIGAYSAGVDGGEIGLIFNIDKGNVQYIQLAGAFNLVGGNVRGVQVGGFFNYVIGDTKAAQITLGYNRVGKNFEGVQISGLYNRVNKDANGVQLSLGLNAIGQNLNGFQVGTLNLISKDTKGIQVAVAGNIVGGKSGGMQIAGVANFNRESNGVNIAALGNFSARNARGMQIGVVNYAGTLNGVQLGIINVSGKNDGYSIGLINISLRGYRKFAFTTNESTQLNVTYKSGNKRFYNMLMFGTNTPSAEKIYTGGMGFGKEINLYKKLSFSTEISSQYVYQGSWDYRNLLHKFELPINIRLTKWLAIQGGPSVNFYYTKQNAKIGNFGLLQEKHKDFSFGNPHYTGWIGWNVGIVLL